MERLIARLEARVDELKGTQARLLEDAKSKLCTFSGKPYAQQLHCNPDDDESVKAVVSQLCPGFLVVGELVVTKISGGITNQLRKVEDQAGAAVLVRVYGGEGMIDRDIETATFDALGDWLERPSFEGRFANGRIEEWLHGYRPFELDDMADHKLSPKIARAMAKLHQFELPTHLRCYFSSTGGLWNTITEWYEQASSPDSAAVITAESAANAEMWQGAEFDMILIKKAIATLKQRVPDTCKLVFSHNDLLSGNLMLNEESGDVKIIDLEYGEINYAAFDVANHFMEYCGGTDETSPTAGCPDYGRLPSQDSRTIFCSEYLKARDGSATEAEISQFLEEVEVFGALDNLYWGLWSVNQAKTESCADFPYLLYAKNRLRRGLEDGGFL